MKKYRLAFLFSLIISSLVFIGCEDESDEKIFGAQKCFNGLDDSLAGTGGASAAAQPCLDKISGLSSSDAQLLRCGITLWVGGINNTTIFNAFDAYDEAADNAKEATLIDSLALSSTAVADEAYGYCESSGAAGMTYIAGLIKIGTYMEAAGAGSTPAVVVDDCLADVANCANADNGEVLITIGDTYCVGDAEESDVCQALAAAQTGTSDPATIMQNFLNQINF